MQSRSGSTDRSRSQDVSVRIASQREDLFSAFELVYGAYLKSDLCEENPYAIRVTGYQTLSTTEILVATVGEEVVCTVSVVGDGVLGLPLESLYPDEVDSRRAAGAALAEVSCLAQTGEDGSFPVVVKLMTLVAQLGKARGVDELLIAVHPRHGRFYARFLGFESIGDVKSYDAVCDNPAVPMSLDLNNLEAKHPRGFATLFGEPIPTEIIRHRQIPVSLRDEIQFLAAETTGHALARVKPPVRDQSAHLLS